MIDNIIAMLKAGVEINGVVTLSTNHCKDLLEELASISYQKKMLVQAGAGSFESSNAVLVAAAVAQIAYMRGMLDDEKKRFAQLHNEFSQYKRDQEQTWIPVSERSPNHSNWVLLEYSYGLETDKTAVMPAICGFPEAGLAGWLDDLMDPLDINRHVPLRWCELPRAK